MPKPALTTESNALHLTAAEATLIHHALGIVTISGTVDQMDGVVKTLEMVQRLRQKMQAIVDSERAPETQHDDPPQGDITP